MIKAHIKNLIQYFTHAFPFLTKAYAVLQTIINIISPSFCCACKAILSERKALCEPCGMHIKPIASTELEITGTYNMRVFCVGAYQEPLKKFVLAKSYSDHIACYYMAQLIYERSLFKHLKPDYIIPIPLHWRRYAHRGYNQSQEIAMYLSRWSGVPILHLLKRTKATAFQSSCDKDQRFENVKGVFSCAFDKTASLRDKKFLLIDDVMTTGATLIAAGKVLATLKPAEITACVLART